ncbi:hypothetical protein IF1G_06112 [Cordyceps javanica]|uniref:Uncharacterized protein n=1 Tax=Cordyceps javanica TaxID=43265 RepID=A0A545V077_9HYPO|nr:hypothetical protein IF1G_06112 [Cordyceps javanica]
MRAKIDTSTVLVIPIVSPGGTWSFRTWPAARTGHVNTPLQPDKELLVAQIGLNSSSPLCLYLPNHGAPPRMSNLQGLVPMQRNLPGR